MAKTYEKNIVIERKTIIARHLIFILILGANFLYLLVLYVISLQKQTGQMMQGASVLLMFVICFSASIIGFVFNQVYFIPKAQKMEEPYNRFPFHLIAVVIGMEAPSMYGIVLGFITLTTLEGINWVIVIIMFLLSFVYGVYFYLFFYQPTLAEIEIGKEITVTRRSK